jgi:hypothetical protein
VSPTFPALLTGLVTNAGDDPSGIDRYQRFRMTRTNGDG